MLRFGYLDSRVECSKFETYDSIRQYAIRTMVYGLIQKQQYVPFIHETSLAATIK